MYKPLTLAICIALAAPISAQASSDEDYGYVRLPPETKAQIRTTLTEQGYEVRRIKMDDGYYEADALKDGVRFEISLDRDFNIIASEIDDDGYARLTPETKAQIRTILTEQGYEVRKIKMDDGYFEAYALKNGVRFEISLDRDLNIIESEIDD